MGILVLHGRSSRDTSRQGVIQIGTRSVLASTGSESHANREVASQTLESEGKSILPQADVGFLRIPIPDFD
jgi:hypothetical protein